MDLFNSYGLIIFGSIIIILSYIYSIISKKTSIPSVLLLITTGIAINLGLKLFSIDTPDFFLILEVLGIVGLIMIVLEASLDLELRKEKRTLITKSLGIALVALILTSLLISMILMIYLKSDFMVALLYAIPLSIISSAVVIPSTEGLNKEKKEFMVYESTFSDILGIMIFYFLVQSRDAESFGEITFNLFLNVAGTIVISFFISYLLVLLFQNIRSRVKLFLLIAVLILLYSIAKLMHLSSLLIILVFGLVLQNRQIFFAGPLKNLIREDSLKAISIDFRIITLESAFVVRTFFFVIFGVTITISSLIDLKVLLVSLLVLIVIYGIRFLAFKLLSIKHYFPEIFLAPRGLITILLFYAIPEEMINDNFDPGVLLFIVIATSLAMTVSLVKDKNNKSKEVPFPEPEVIKSEDIKPEKQSK